MNQPKRFRINRPTVIHETIDNEVIIVEFNSGSYYSLDKAGADIWELIDGGYTVSEIVEGIGRLYEGTPEEIENAVTQLIDEMQQENLVAPDSVLEKGNADAPKLRIKADLEIGQPIFETPNLHKYTDMQDLLLLDPIHDVDETGWPSAKPDLLETGE
jgi:hypothetical protein